MAEHMDVMHGRTQLVSGGTDMIRSQRYDSFGPTASCLAKLQSRTICKK